jgi:hypothetical protein
MASRVDSLVLQFDPVSIVSHPLFLTIVGAVLGWIGKLLYDRYITNLRYGQRIAQGTIERVLGYTERHYFPLSSRGFQLVSALNAAVGSKDEELRSDYLRMALYRFAQYLAVDSRITKETGGLLLMKDFEIEKTIVQLKLEIVKALPFRLSDREYLIEMGELDFTKFERKLSDKRMRFVYGQLVAWVKDALRVKSFSKYVVCQNELMAHALGNLYRPWYGKKAPPISKESEEIIRELKRDCSNPVRGEGLPSL